MWAIAGTNPSNPQVQLKVGTYLTWVDKKYLIVASV